MQVNDQVELKIEGLTSDGKGIANYHHYRIFVLNALPQERVKAKINQLGKKRAQAVSEEILEPSPVRVKDTDEEWLRKGFAPLANLKYEEQLSFKQMRVKHLLAKAGLNEVPVAPTVASPEQMHYRNEGLAPVRQVKGKLEVGFFKQPGKQFVPLHRFFSVKPEVQTALFCVRDILRQLKIPAYDPKQETGFIRGIDIWRSEARGDIMVTLIARKKDLVELPQLVGLITEKIKHFAGVVLNYNPHQTDKTFGKENIPVWGNDYIVDEINHLQFKISPRSYFEPNSQQVRRILHLLLISADLHPDDQVIDADCGVGTIGLSVANQVKGVRGIDIVRSAIEDAKYNAKINHLSNVHYYPGNVEQIISRWAKQEVKADVIFTDPSLRGLSKGSINAINKLQPRKLVYLSGNPDTLVRDLQRFEKVGYHCKQVTPIDIAPQTPYEKCIAVLQH